MSQPAGVPRYQYATDDRKESGSAEEHHGFQRAHREPGQLELGLTEVAQGRSDVQRTVAPSAGLSNSRFRARWNSRKPEWVSALMGEFFGVLFFTFMGTAATALFVLSAIAGTQYGSFMNIGLAYAFGITFGILVGGVSSSAHFHPAITICQVIYKGFPISKAPFYIVAQILGGYIGALMTYAINKHEMDQVVLLLRSEGQDAVIFSPSGPAGIIALFPAAGRPYSDMFANEFFGALVIGLVIWANLDSRNIFTSPTNAPWAIGLVYFVVVSTQAAGALALNSARDLGARFACASIWGTECFAPSQYTALAALTNIPVTIIAAGIYEFFLSDNRRAPAPIALGHLLEHEKTHQQNANDHHEEYLSQKISRAEGGNAEPGLWKSITGRGSASRTE